MHADHYHVFLLSFWYFNVKLVLLVLVNTVKAASINLSTAGRLCTTFD